MSAGKVATLYEPGPQTEWVVGEYRGCRYRITEAPDGRARLAVEHVRAPPATYHEDFHAARLWLRDWVDLDSRQQHSRGLRETRERQERTVREVFGKRV